MAYRSSSDFQRDPPLLVGRDRELNRLRSVIERVLDGHGQVVLMAGEAGIGKTTLTTALIRQPSLGAALVLTGHCYDLTTTPPYGPWLEILHAVRNQNRSFQLPNTLADDTALASAPGPDALFEAFLTFFREVAAHQPLVLILEDVHWADQASLDVMRYVIRQIGESRLLVVITYRDDEITRRHPLFQLLPILVREAPVERLLLRRLNAEDIQALVSSRYELSQDDAARVTRYLWSLSDGNPFYAHELLDALVLEHIQGIEVRGATLGDLDKVRTPPLLKQVIERRMARLEVTTRDALEVAAVIGQDVPLDVWQAVLDLPEDQLEPVVQEALEHHILEESPGRPGWRFTHALVREALHEGITLMRRRRLHRRVAEILTALPAPDPDMVAYQFQQAGDPRATDWLIQAGERAQRSHAWFSAADRFEAAVGLLEAMPERDRERGWLLYRISQLRRFAERHQGIAYLDEALGIALACDDEELAAAVLQGRGLLKCFAGDVQTGLAELEAGVVAAERLGLEAASSVRPGAVLNRSAYAMWLSFVGRFEEAITMAQQQLAKMTEPRAVGASYRALGVAHSFLGHPDLARQAFVRDQEISATIHDLPNAYISLVQELISVVLPYHADNPAERANLEAEVATLIDRAKGNVAAGSWTTMHSPELPILEGDWIQARDLIGEPNAGPDREWRLMWTAVLAHHQAPIGEAWRRMHELLPNGPLIEPETVTVDVVIPIRHLIAQPAFDSADLEIARTWLDAFDRWLAWSGAVLGRAESAALWAQFHQALGDLSQARTHADQALAFASDPRQPLALIAAHRVLGQIEILDGRYSEAEQHLRASLALANACVTPFERALALLALAELHLARETPDDARALLGEVVRICQPLEARAAQARAEALLTDLNAMRPVTDERGGLSAREIEVLRLVAQGMIDREIAAALFISPRTVTTHVTHILDKLGVNTRTEAAAHALREGII